MSTTIDTPVGPFTLLMRGEAVLASGFTDDAQALWELVHPQLRGEYPEVPDAARKAVSAYFDGDLTAIDQVEVVQHTDGGYLGGAWDVLREVRPGTPVTYTEYARLTGRPAAVRAAAQACARNAAALFVPCHRVVRTDGTLGGYRWGLDVKRFLLRHEETRS
jgi:methylated-DNA-[protein]-cysteine S-methyltransferase